LEYQNYVLQTINYRNKLNTFLWADEHIPLELATSASPDTTYKVASLVVDKIDSLQSIWMNEYHLKRRAIEIDRKLYAEYLKPEIDVNYNPLLIPQANNFLPVFNPVNYKFGINASYSLLLRKERANLNLAKVKLEGTENSTALKFQELEMKLSTVIQMLANLSDQIVMQERMVSYYKTITSAELTKYQIGESTQFVVNSREMKYLESKMKLVDLKAKYYAMYAQYIYLTQ
jgi:outer membrane protein